MCYVLVIASKSPRCAATNRGGTVLTVGAGLPANYTVRATALFAGKPAPTGVFRWYRFRVKFFKSVARQSLTVRAMPKRLQRYARNDGVVLHGFVTVQRGEGARNDELIRW